MIQLNDFVLFRMYWKYGGQRAGEVLRVPGVRRQCDASVWRSGVFVRAHFPVEFSRCGSRIAWCGLGLKFVSSSEDLRAQYLS